MRRARTAATFVLAATAACGGGREKALDAGLDASFLDSPFATSLSSLSDCDEGAADVQIIDSPDDWQTINIADKRVFCVAPGDYTSRGQIRLTASGTEAAPRILRMLPAADSDRTIHPVKLQEASRGVILGLRLDAASQWIIDGITVSGSVGAGGYNIEVLSGSESNVFSRMLIEHGTGTAMLLIRENAHYNTVQNSVLRETVVAPRVDHNCLNLFGAFPNSIIRGTRIVANEMYDCNQGVQLVVIGDSTNVGSQGTTYPGTLIADNDIYLTPAMHRVCQDPNPRQCEAGESPAPGVCSQCTIPATGECAAAESGIAIKGGGTGPGPTESVNVLQNRIWGMRRTNSAFGGTGAWGVGIESCCYPTSFVTIRDNVLIDNARGVSLQLASHTSITDNLLVDMPLLLSTCGAPATGMALAMSSDSTEFYRNTIINAGVAAWRLSEQSADYRCNVFIDSGMAIAGPSAVLGPAANAELDYNFYYGTPQLFPAGAHDLTSGSGSDSMNADRVIARRRHTGPETVTVPLGMPTAASPHTASCDPALGARPGIGVDDVQLP